MRPEYAMSRACVRIFNIKATHRILLFATLFTQQTLLAGARVASLYRRRVYLYAN